MASNRFRTGSAWRVALLTAAVGATLAAWLHAWPVPLVAVLGLVAVFQAVALVRFVEQTNVDLARFLTALAQDDVSQAFTARGRGATFARLSAAFTDAMARVRQARATEEERRLYIETVVQHVGTGLLVFDGDGLVHVLNTAAKRILGVPSLATLQDIHRFDPVLGQALQQLKAGDKILLNIERFNERVHLSASASEFRMRGQQYTLVSLQNIGSELEDREMEAYQKLIRVLTHEIMNSITPIASLAGTLRRLLNAEQRTAMESSTEEEILGAVETIEKRSLGLLRFVDAYRDLSRIPKPEFVIVRVKDVMTRIYQLLAPEMAKRSITFTVEVDPEGLEITADPALVDQALINIVLNAMQAVEDQKERRIRLSGRLQPGGHILLEVADNGPGISDEARDKLFVPFFTTKKDGSGIGLSLSKEIMRLHHGTISVHAKPGTDTLFRLIF